MIFFSRFLLMGVLVLGLCSSGLAQDNIPDDVLQEIILDSPTIDAKVTRPLVLFKGRVKGVRLLLLNGAPVPIKEDGRFFYRAQLFAKNSYNFFILKGESSDGRVIYLNRKVFYKSLESVDELGANIEKSLIFDMAKLEDQRLKVDYDHQEAMGVLKKQLGENMMGGYTFSEITLQEFLKLFALEHRLNIINDTTEIVKPLSVELRDIHPVDVFDSLLQSWGCTWYIRNNVIRVISQMPFKVYKLNYIAAEQLLKSITGVTSLNTVNIQETNNSIVAQGTEAQLDQLSELVKDLDVRPHQVLIEATIVETSFDISKSLGVDWSALAESKSSGVSSLTAMTSGRSPYNIKVGSLTVPYGLLQNSASANILANPHLLVTNHKTAEITTGSKIGYSTTAVTSTTTIQNMNFLETGISLKITPHISDSGEILMELAPSISEGKVDNNMPRSTNTKTNTQVLVKNGQTIVIGGLIQRKEMKDDKKVPLLSKIPLIGSLFSSQDRTDQKLEISVLITPHIIPSGVVETAESSKLEANNGG